MTVSVTAHQRVSVETVVSAHLKSSAQRGCLKANEQRIFVDENRQIQFFFSHFFKLKMFMKCLDAFFFLMVL